jgi:hypothetical protein
MKCCPNDFSRFDEELQSSSRFVEQMHVKNQPHRASGRFSCREPAASAVRLIHRIAKAGLVVGILACCVLQTGCGSPTNVQQARVEVADHAPDVAVRAEVEFDAANDVLDRVDHARSNDQRLASVLASGKVEFRRGEGVEVFSFKPSDESSCKFNDQHDTELCKLSFSGNRLKAKSRDDEPLFELKPKDDKVMLKDPTGDVELFKFKLKGSTIDFYLPNDQRVYRIKQAGDGWRLEDDADNTLFRAKVKDDRVVLRDASDRTVLYSKDIAEPLGLLFFEMKPLTIEQQAACCVFFLEYSG